MAERGQELRGRRPLEALSFFMADMQAGIGPFLGVLLLSHGWRAGAIGTVISVGAVAGMLAVGPCGALVDATSHKRSWIAEKGLPELLDKLAR